MKGASSTQGHRRGWSHVRSWSSRAIAVMVVAGCNTLVGIGPPHDRDPWDGSGSATSPVGSIGDAAPTSADATIDAGRPREVAVPDGSIGSGGSSGGGPVYAPPGGDASEESDRDVATVPPTGPCPAVLPAENDPCPAIGLECQYGSDPREDTCRPTATCSASGWLPTRHVCPVDPVTSCPPSLEDAEATACPALFAWCNYESGLACECTNCATGVPYDQCTGLLTWHCQQPNPTPMCPPTLPNAGQTCAPDGLSCAYHCGAFGVRQCSGGIWIRNSGLKCPRIPPD